MDWTGGLQSTPWFPMQLLENLMDTAAEPEFGHEVCCANNGVMVSGTNGAKLHKKKLRARLHDQRATQERPRQLEEKAKGLQRTPKSPKKRTEASPKGPEGLS